MEISKGCQELGCCLAVCCVSKTTDQKSVPLVGCPALPFIDQGRARVTDGRKRKKPKVEKVLRGSRVFLFPCACPANMADRVRDSMFADPYRAVPWPLSARWLRPILRRWMVRHVRGLSYGPLGSRWGSDPTSITIGDVNSILDCSGCRMLVLLSTSKG